MKVIPDLTARMTALTAVNRTLLVEAGAGSGKTSVMAGRVAVLFAGGVEPKHIAAITFTEFAASELRLRIERFSASTAAARASSSALRALFTSPLLQASASLAASSFTAMSITRPESFAARSICLVRSRHRCANGCSAARAALSPALSRAT